MDSAPGSPLQLQPVPVPVVRLNRRVLYVLGAVLSAVVVVGLVALRAQGPRAASDPAPVPLAGAAAGDRWFDKVPDREPPPVATPDLARAQRVTAGLRRRQPPRPRTSKPSAKSGRSGRR
jgi:hypothetical protein